MTINMTSFKHTQTTILDPVKSHEPTAFWFLRRSFLMAPIVGILAMILITPDPVFDIRLHQNGQDAYIDVQVNGQLSNLGHKLSSMLNCSRIVRRVGDPEFEPCQVYHSSGVLISTLHDLPDMKSPVDLYLVPPGRPFMWPSVHVGHQAHAGHVPTADQHSIIVETLSMSPRVFRIHNIMSEDEVDQVLKEARDVRQKNVSDRYRSNINERRTGEDWNADKSETVEAIRQRTRAMLGMNVPDSWSEPFEMLIYGPGKCFTLHDDYIDAETLSYQPEFDIRSELLGSNRYATVIFYFNDVELGGETVFAYGDPIPGMAIDNQDAIIEHIMSNNTEAELLKAAGIHPGTFEMSLLATCRSRFSVKPKRGSAVLFYNQLPEGGVDVKALHGGCPVLKGEKVAANIITWNGPTNLASEEEIEALISQTLYSENKSLESDMMANQDVEMNHEDEYIVEEDEKMDGDDEMETGDEDMMQEEEPTDEVTDISNVQNKD